MFKGFDSETLHPEPFFTVKSLIGFQTFCRHKIYFPYKKGSPIEGCHISSISISYVTLVDLTHWFFAGLFYGMKYSHSIEFKVLSCLPFVFCFAGTFKIRTTSCIRTTP